MINIKNFNSDLLTIGKKSYKTLIFITLDTSKQKVSVIMKVFIVQIHCTLLLVRKMDTLKKNGNKYLIFASKNKNKEVLKNYTEHRNGVKSPIENIDEKPGEYGKYYFSIFMTHNLHRKTEYTITRYFKNTCGPGGNIKIKR